MQNRNNYETEFKAILSKLETLYNEGVQVNAQIAANQALGEDIQYPLLTMLKKLFDNKNNLKELLITNKNLDEDNKIAFIFDNEKKLLSVSALHQNLLKYSETIENTITKYKLAIKAKMQQEPSNGENASSGSNSFAETPKIDDDGSRTANSSKEEQSSPGFVSQLIKLYNKISSLYLASKLHYQNAMTNTSYPPPGSFASVVANLSVLTKSILNLLESDNIPSDDELKAGKKIPFKFKNQNTSLAQEKNYSDKELLQFLQNQLELFQKQIFGFKPTVSSETDSNKSKPY